MTCLCRWPAAALYDMHESFYGCSFSAMPREVQLHCKKLSNEQPRSRNTQYEAFIKHSLKGDILSYTAYTFRYAECVPNLQTLKLWRQPSQFLLGCPVQKIWASSNSSDLVQDRSSWEWYHPSSAYLLPQLENCICEKRYAASIMSKCQCWLTRVWPWIAFVHIHYMYCLSVREDDAMMQ